jgi:hypothetical protein
MHDNKILEELFRYIFNPISGFIFSAVLSWLFYVKKNEGLIRSAPFIIFGIDLIMWVIFPVVASGSVFALLVYGAPSFFSAIFYLIFNLRRTSKFFASLAGGISDNKKNTNNESKFENIIVLYLHFIINSIFMLYLITDLFLDNILDSYTGFALIVMFLFVSTLYVFFRKLSAKLYYMPIIVTGYLTSYFMMQSFFGRSPRGTHLGIEIFSKMIYLIPLFSFWFNIKYLKYFKEQQLIQNQDEI